jgi:hypothetical protein
MWTSRTYHLPLGFILVGTWCFLTAAPNDKIPSPVPESPSPQYGWTARDLDRKIKIIRVPEVKFFDAPLPEVLNFLQEHSAKHDPEAKANPKFAGVQFVLLTRETPPPTITLHLRNARLSSILDFTVELIGYDYQVRNAAIVVFKPKPKPAKQKGTRLRSLETEFFKLNEDLVRRLGGH